MSGSDPIIDSFLEPDQVTLGPDCRIDELARVGYHTGRKLEDRSLKIGGGARIRAGSVIYVGSDIGPGLETGHNAVIREECRIGANLRIWNNATIDYGVTIGSDVKLHCNVYVAQFTVLEDDVFLAPGVTIANDMHPGCSRSYDCMRGPILRRGVQVGVNATILPFVEIGEESLIGSGAVVYQDVPPRSVVVGHPGRVVKKIDHLYCVSGLKRKPYPPGDEL